MKRCDSDLFELLGMERVLRKIITYLTYFFHTFKWFIQNLTNIFKDRGQILLLKMATELEDIAIVEALPKMDGKRMFMYLSPKKKK